MANVMDRVAAGIDTGVNSVKAGSRAMVGKARINTQISDLKKTRSSVLMNIGRTIYEMYKGGELAAEQCEPVCRDIDEMNNELSGIRNRLNELEQDRTASAQSGYAEYESTHRAVRRRSETSRNGLKIVTRIANAAVIVLLVLMTLGYPPQLVESFIGNIKVFEFLDTQTANLCKTVSLIVGIGMTVSSAVSLILFILSKKSARVLTVSGAVLMIEGIALKICCALYPIPKKSDLVNSLFSDSSDLLDPARIALFRAFGAYESVAGFTIFVAAVMLTIGIAALIKKQKGINR